MYVYMYVCSGGVCLCECMRLSLIWGTPARHEDLMNELTWQPLQSVCVLERGVSERVRERNSLCWMKNVFIHLFRLHLDPPRRTASPLRSTPSTSCILSKKKKKERFPASVSFHRFSTRRANNFSVYYTWFPPFFPFPTHIYTGWYA